MSSTNGGLGANYVGTVHTYQALNATKDAEILQQALKLKDEKAFIDILCNRTAVQRVEIAKFYKTQIGKELAEDIKSKFSSDFRNLMVELCQTLPAFQAKVVMKAMKGLGTDEDALIEIICTRSNSEMEALKDAFTRHFKKNLEREVQSETSGFFQRVLVACLQANRDETAVANLELAKRDAKDLFDAGEKRWGTDESKFLQIMVTRSYSHLRVVFDEYRKICNYTLEDSIGREMSGDLSNALRTLAQVARNQPMYFANLLHKSMKGLGTTDTLLIRNVILRSEVDMVQVKAQFLAVHRNTLKSFIKGDTSGNYQRALLSLIGESP